MGVGKIQIGTESPAPRHVIGLWLLPLCWWSSSRSQCRGFYRESRRWLESSGLVGMIYLKSTLAGIAAAFLSVILYVVGLIAYAFS